MESSSEVFFLSFHPNYDTWFWQKRMRHIPGRMQLRHQSMIAWWCGITQDIQHFVNKCKNCQLNSRSLGKTVSTWPEADVWERLHMDWGFVKDQGNILVIVVAVSGWIEAFPAGNRTSETVKIYLSQIFARIGIPKTLMLMVLNL